MTVVSHQVNLLLKLAQYLAELFVFAEPRATELAELSQFCLVFLNSYARSHLGRVEAAVGQLGAEGLAQRSKGICSLLRLLSYLTTRDVAECLSMGATICSILFGSMPSAKPQSCMQAKNPTPYLLQATQ